MDAEVSSQNKSAPDPAQQPNGLQVSVILIGHNQAGPLRRAISALENSQRRDRMEILLVDCGSSDDSPRLDVEFPSINILRLPHHFGATKAMNIATRTAKADLLLFLSPDVEVAPDSVTRLAERLEQDPDAAAACLLLINTAGKPSSNFYPFPTPESLVAAAVGDPLPRAQVDLAADAVNIEYAGREALLVRRQFVAGMNYFDERFGEYWADADLAMQIRRSGKRIRLYPSLRATRASISDPLANEAIAINDRATGAAALVAKYHGFMAGLAFRLKVILRGIILFKFGLVGAMLGGQKLDGSQAG